MIAGLAFWVILDLREKSLRAEKFKSAPTGRAGGMRKVSVRSPGQGFTGNR
jgi:hypothetical protein